MPQCQRNRYPNVSVQIRLIGWARRRIVMDIGPLDMGPVPLGRRIVDHQQQTLRQRQCPQYQNHQLRRNRFALASNTGKEVIIVLEVVADAGGPEPSRHRASTAGEQDARQHHRQSPAIAGVQPSRQPFAPLRPLIGTFPTTFRIRHPWLLHCAACLATAA